MSIGLSVTGIAGPGGATATKPVGLVYVGLNADNGETVTREHRFHGDRTVIKQRSSQAALDLLRRWLLAFQTPKAASMIRAFLAVQEGMRGHDPQFASNFLNRSERLSRPVQSEVKRRITHDVPRDVSLSWVRPASMHLTVKFLGDIAEELVLPLREAIADTLSPHRVLQIPLDRLGVFPRPQQPRVLWIGPSEQWEARTPRRGWRRCTVRSRHAA